MSFILLGILNSQAAGGAGAAGELQLIQTQTLDSADTTVTFSGLDSFSSQYQHLHLRGDWGRDGSDSAGVVYAYFNGNTTNSDYRFTDIRNTGSSPSSFSGEAPTLTLYSGSTPTGVYLYDILNPYDTSTITTMRGFGGNMTSSANHSSLTVVNWDYATSLTSLSLTSSGSFCVGSRVSLYGYKVAA